MYRNVLFRAIIDRIQWGGAGRGSRETATAENRDKAQVLAHQAFIP